MLFQVLGSNYVEFQFLIMTVVKQYVSTANHVRFMYIRFTHNNFNLTPLIII